jgi:hypothetical protein
MSNILNRKNCHTAFASSLFFIAIILTCIVFSQIALAEAPACKSSYGGAIFDHRGNMISGLSGITQRTPTDVFLISDRSDVLYHSRYYNGQWYTEYYGISSSGTGPSRWGISDIEDISYGPCPDKSYGRCIYIGQIGKNRKFAQKDRFNIHYIREMDLNGQAGRYVRTFKNHFRYPDRRRFDAEGMTVHPATGDLFVITKTEGNFSYIFKVDLRYPGSQVKEVAQINLAQLFSDYRDTNVRQITGFEISPDGTRFVISTYEAIVEFNLNLATVNNITLPGNIPLNRRSLLNNRWRTSSDLRRAQVEAITYYGNGSDFLVIGENDPSVMVLSCTVAQQPLSGIACANNSIPADGSLTGYNRLYGGGHSSIPMKGDYACTGRGQYLHVTSQNIMEYTCNDDYTNCRLTKVNNVIKLETKPDHLVYWVSGDTWWVRKRNY